MQVFSPWLNKGFDVRPTIAVTKAHIDLPEVREAVRVGRLKPDGKVLSKEGQSFITKVTHSSQSAGCCCHRVSMYGAKANPAQVSLLFVYSCMTKVRSPLVNSPTPTPTSTPTLLLTPTPTLMPTPTPTPILSPTPTHQHQRQHQHHS